MERIGDIFFQISKTIERKIEDKVWFNQQQRNRLSEMFDLIDEAFTIMINNLDADHYDKVSKIRHWKWRIESMNIEIL